MSQIHGVSQQNARRHGSDSNLRIFANPVTAAKDY